MDGKKEERSRERTLLDQRRAIIEFGRSALASTSLDDILNDACEHCRRALGTELSKVMRLEDDGRVLRVVAGVGWKEGVVGEETVPALKESSEGFAIRSAGAVVSPDIEEEDRFDYADFLKRHGVKAIVNVVIPGPDGDPPFGLLQVDSTEETEFTDEHIEFLQGYANIVGAAIIRFRRADEVVSSLDERNRALAELQHRVSNNLAILSALLQYRSEQSDSAAAQLELGLVKGHIDALARLHELLAPNRGIDRVDIGDFLNSLCSQVSSFSSRGDHVCNLESRVECVLVDSSIALPLGLIANEFVTNSIKHATIEGVCDVHLIVEERDGELHVVLKDKGAGTKETSLERADGTGQGVSLVEGLADQIDASIRWDLSEGTQLSIVVALGGEDARP